MNFINLRQVATRVWLQRIAIIPKTNNFDEYFANKNRKLWVFENGDPKRIRFIKRY